MRISQQKVLLVVPRMNQGGAESHTYQLALGLSRQGVAVHVASGGGHLAALLQQHGIPHFVLPIRYSKLLSVFMIQRLFLHEQYDIVHAHCNDAALVVAAACRTTPWVMTAHGPIEARSIFRRLARARTIICVSHALQNCLSQIDFLQATPQCVIHNGIDISMLSEQTHQRQQGPSPDELSPFTLGIAARLSANIIRNNAKGHDDLLQILASHPQATTWRLLIAGKGAGMSKLQARVQHFGLTNRVTFLGLVSDMSQFYARLDVFALPTRGETFGLALAEAMAAGVPVVSYAVGGVPEVVEDGMSGFLAPCGDIAQLAESLVQLANNPTMRHIMGHAGHSRICQNFNSATMVAKTLEVYQTFWSSQNMDRCSQ